MTDWIKNIPPELGYVFLAITGGVARYLNSYASGKPFNIGIFLASVFISGFSGYIFALVGISMYLPFPFIFMMSGVGGFFSDQAMKWALEFTGLKINSTSEK